MKMSELTEMAKLTSGQRGKKNNTKSSERLETLYAERGKII